MKYEAINDWIIVERDLQAKTTSSGIILNETEELQTLKHKVISAAGVNEKLIGMYVMAPRHKVHQFNQSNTILYGGVKLEDICGIVTE